VAGVAVWRGRTPQKKVNESQIFFAIRNQIQRASRHIRPNQYWVSDNKCKNLAYDLKPHPYVAIYQRRFDPIFLSAVQKLPIEARIFYKHWVNAYISYPTWAIAYSHADELFRELEEKDIKVGYILFYDSKGKIGKYSLEYAELMLKFQKEDLC
jgi:hypothetical protein